MPGAQQPTMSAGGSAGGAPGGYPEYNRMQGPQAGPPGPPNVEGGAGPSDYSSFGKSSPFGNFFLFKVCCSRWVCVKVGQRTLFTDYF